MGSLLELMPICLRQPRCLCRLRRPVLQAPSPPPPAPCAVCRLLLAFQLTKQRQPTPRVPPQLSPSPGRPTSQVIVYCSQYRMEDYQPGSGRTGRCQGTRRFRAGSATCRQRTRPTGVAGHRLTRRRSRSPQGSNQNLSLSTAVPAPARPVSPPLTRIKNRDLYVHKDYEGRLPLCCYVTGPNEGGPHDFYPSYTKKDILA